VGKTFPAAPDADDLATDFAAAVNNRFDNRVQSRNIAAARENTDTLRRHISPDK
jgi:hypothetical protein